MSFYVHLSPFPQPEIVTHVVQYQLPEHIPLSGPFPSHEAASAFCTAAIGSGRFARAEVVTQEQKDAAEKRRQEAVAGFLRNPPDLWGSIMEVPARHDSRKCMNCQGPMSGPWTESVCKQCRLKPGTMNIGGAVVECQSVQLLKDTDPTLARWQQEEAADGAECSSCYCQRCFRNPVKHPAMQHYPPYCEDCNRELVRGWAPLCKKVEDGPAPIDTFTTQSKPVWIDATGLFTADGKPGVVPDADTPAVSDGQESLQEPLVITRIGNGLQEAKEERIRAILTEDADTPVITEAKE